MVVNNICKLNVELEKAKEEAALVFCVSISVKDKPWMI